MRAVSVAAVPLILAGTMITGCSEAAGPQAGDPQPGVLQVLDYTGNEPKLADPTVVWSVGPTEGAFVPPLVLDAPDTVAVGAPFDVTVTTIGMSGCWAAAGQDMEVDGGIVELMPMDVHSGAEVCTGILLFLSHTSTVTLDSPGEWTLRVRGRRVRQHDVTWQEPVSAERAVHAR